MKRFSHGLVLGKFYPPHIGHHHLICSAAGQCERVTVLVMASSVETIALSERLRWLRLEHARDGVEVVGVMDDHPIDYHDDSVWSLHVNLALAAIARNAVLRGRPAEAAAVDAVYSGEDYGLELAQRMGAEAMIVARTTAPNYSGTQVRADVVGSWHKLAAATKAGLAMRAVFLGAESSGTTTTSLAVRDALQQRGGVWGQTAWVPEYGREYTIGILAAARAQAAHVGQPAPGMDDLLWTSEDFVDIAQRQLAMEDEAAAQGSPVLICDTDAFATGVWEERYLQSRSRDVDLIANSRPHPLYFLTSHKEVPFLQDGIRDGEHVREWMTQRFIDRLQETGRNWVLLQGSIEQRTEAALKAIDDLCAKYWQFGKPLTEGIQ